MGPLYCTPPLKGGAFPPMNIPPTHTHCETPIKTLTEIDLVPSNIIIIQG